MKIKLFCFNKRITLICILFFVHVVLPLITLISYFITLADLGPVDFAFIDTGRALPGVFLFYWFMAQFVTGSRFKPLEKLAGLPALIRIHFVTAMGCLVGLFFHFVFQGIPTNFYGWAGVVAGSIFLFLTYTGVAQWIETPLLRLPFIRYLFQKAKEKYQYQSLKRRFDLGAVAAVFVYLHISGSSLYENNPLFPFLGNSYFILTFSCYLYHKLLRPFLLRKSPWRLTKISPGGDPNKNDVTILSFAPVSRPKGSLFKRWKYRAGQFAFLRFITGKLKNEEHPFSLLSHPKEEEVSFAIQNDGDFTNRLRTEAKPEDKAVIDGPYGLFFPTKFQLDSPPLFIAGGIGIVPMVSLFKEMQVLSSPATLYWLSHEPPSFLYKELKRMEMESHGHLELEIFSRRLGNPLCKEHILSLSFKSNREVFLCASRELTLEIKTMLLDCGISKKRIHTELFSM